VRRLRPIHLEALAQLVRASVLFRMTDPAHATRLLHSDVAGTVSAKDVERARQAGRAVASVSGRLPWHPTCLRQAVAVRAMLRRRGIASELTIGVTSPREERPAHAWVRVGERVIVGGAGHEQYTPIARF